MDENTAMESSAKSSARVSASGTDRAKDAAEDTGFDDLFETDPAMQAARPARAPDGVRLTKPELPFATILGVLALTSASSIYLAYGVSAYPRQEWLLETLASTLFILPVLNLLKTPGSFAKAVRILGAMLILHSLWDALHWPGQTLIETPIDPWIPRACPFVDLAIGTWLLVRGR